MNLEFKNNFQFLYSKIIPLLFKSEEEFIKYLKMGKEDEATIEYKVIEMYIGTLEYEINDAYMVISNHCDTNIDFFDIKIDYWHMKKKLKSIRSQIVDAMTLFLGVEYKEPLLKGCISEFIIKLKDFLKQYKEYFNWIVFVEKDFDKYIHKEDSIGYDQ